MGVPTARGVDGIALRNLLCVAAILLAGSALFAQQVEMTVLMPRVAAAADVPAEAFDFSTEARRPRIQYTYQDIAAPTDSTSAEGWTDYLDFAGNLKSVTDPAEALQATPKARVSFVYDTSTEQTKRDRVISQVWGTGESATISYPSSMGTGIVDALGQITHYSLIRTADQRLQIKAITQAGCLAESVDCIW